MFKTKLKVKLDHIRDGVKWYKLKEDLVYQDKENTYIIPAGFNTDLTTIPKPLDKWIKPDNKKYQREAILHDYLYCLEIGKVKSDLIYYKAMKTNKVPLRYRVPFFLAVFCFGWFYYKKL